MQLTVPYVNTIDNLADLFTKPLTARVFYPMRDAIMNMSSSDDSLRYGGASEDEDRGMIAPRA